MTDRLEAWLGPLESNDPFLQRALATMASLLEGTDGARRLAGVRIFVCDYTGSPAHVRASRYHTENCAALFDEHAILINEGYLLENEAAMRSFALAGDLLCLPYLRSDEDLFGLVQRVRPDPRAYVTRLRALDDLPGRGGAALEAVHRFALLLAFLVGHELGHLAQRHDQRAFGAFVDADAPPETRLDNAVVRLARHARELARLGFDLSGFEPVIDEDSEVGADEKRRRHALREMQINHERWFADESAADGFATQLVQDILDRIATADPQQSDRGLAGVVDALFAVAMYQWQRDLTVFLSKIGLPGLGNAQALVFKMMEDREHYVHAAELFGDVHRFTMLRAILAIDAWLHARGVLGAPIDQPVRRLEPPGTRAPMAHRDALQCWQREALLRIHLDTAVKIANVGAGTGWMLDAEQARGSPQLFMMQFESIGQSVRRLRRMQHREH